MKKLSFLAAAIFAVVAFVSFNPVSAGEGLAIGATMDDFKLTDTSGAEKSLNDLKGKNGAILVFLSVQCPVVKAYDERIVKLADDYKSKGIAVVGINSNATESLDWVKSYADENYKASTGYKFPILIDKGNVWADKLGANVTPEVLFFSAKGELLYRGAIDDDRSGKNISNNYLRDALEANLAGKAIVKTSANAFGCSIKRAN